MSVKKLIKEWEHSAHAELTKDLYSIKLNLDDAARIKALSEMYPKRSTEQLLSELISAALSEIESSLPYIAGSEVASFDELGDPIYKDVGPTPIYLSLMQKYIEEIRGKQTN